MPIESTTKKYFVFFSSVILVLQVENSSHIHNQLALNSTRNQTDNSTFSVFLTPPSFFTPAPIEFMQRNERNDLQQNNNLYFDEKTYKSFGISYFDCLYFVIVTISTVHRC